MMKHRRNLGITLIELMVVLVIVAILASIAYPSYRQYSIRANRTEAKVALMQAAQALEKCFTRYHRYNDPACDAVANFPFNTPKGHYAIAPVGAIGDDAYVVGATPLGGQLDDTRCGTLSIDQAGMTNETGTDTIADCW